MADYECQPLWDSEGSGLRNFNPFDLPITEELANALTAWAEEYTATLHRADPATSGFRDVASAEAWLHTGAELAKRLRQEGLGIDYFHDRQAPAELVAEGN
jgi:hypothetical protein